MGGEVAARLRHHDAPRERGAATGGREEGGAARGVLRLVLEIELEGEMRRELGEHPAGDRAEIARLFEAEGNGCAEIERRSRASRA